MKTLILGFDAFDPVVFERLNEEGRLPYLGKYLQIGGYARFEIANPPQSEVSWTSIATGLNPGGHGLFDFVHRDPSTYGLYVSLLPTGRGLGGTRFVPPHSARTIFDQAAAQGFPATALWWPATFPARVDSPVRTLPGLGTPDIHGRLGVGTLLSADLDLGDRQGKTPVLRLQAVGDDHYQGHLLGPARKTRQGTTRSSIPVELERLDDTRARARLGDQVIDLQVGVWSPILTLRFKVGRLVSLQALTRVILTRTKPFPYLYLLPLQLHPLHSAWPYATPRRFVRQVWKDCGPFLTIGWPQESVGLEDGCINESQFLSLCESIFQTRSRVLLRLLDSFQEGLLASVFDTLDRVQHMFWRNDPEVIEDWYLRYDRLVSRVEQKLEALGGDLPRLVIVSDHGFTAFDHKVHLNRWLIERGYLQVETTSDGQGSLKTVDWTQTRAYALGLNSLYLNLAGREGQGLVLRTERLELLDRLKEELLAWIGPDGRPVVNQALHNAEVFYGPLCEYGPDLIVGYAPGYRASQETGLGCWKSLIVEPNRDLWSGDHCVDASAVPGVIFSNLDLRGVGRLSYREFPNLTIGADPDPTPPAPPPPLSEEETQVIEERLRSLGYL